MTADERARLNADGYVVREDVFDAAECADIIAECEALALRLGTEKQRHKLRVGGYMIEFERELGIVAKWEPQAPELLMGLEPVARISPPLAALGRDSRLVDPSKAVVGHDELDLFTEKLNFKRARHGGAIWLHQDYPYWADVAPIAARVATAMLFLDDATVAKGCLEVAPGSHREGVRARKGESDFGSREMDPAAYDDRRLIPLEVRAGAVAWFGAFLVHRSLPNRSAEDRRALLHSYQPAGYPHLSALSGANEKRVLNAV
jgi:ectoine hydroxylase-related dioxygenase (phytanoyl-CoA dioxygenase family)